MKNFKLHFFILLVASSLLFNVIGCKKKEKEIIVTRDTSVVKDIDGNEYKTIKIGNKWWMAENLKVKNFRNGDPIVPAQSDSKWTKNVSNYCLYDDNNFAPGLLYNWYAVADSRGIAPEGWHVATEEDWKELEKFLGMPDNELDKLGWRGNDVGSKLKIESPKNWTTKNGVWSTNESGFSALPGSCRLFNGKWGDPGIGATGFWWTATEKNDNNEAWYRYLDYKNNKIFRSHFSKNYGLSVRCVKD